MTGENKSCLRFEYRSCGGAKLDLKLKIEYTYTFMNNPCIRCGKQRIDGKSWKEKGTSSVTYIQTICPDPDCQKIVDKATKDRIAKNDLMLKNKANAKLAREKALAEGKIAAAG